MVAIAIGAIVAVLVATVMSEAVKGQRSIVDRDEASEFSLYIKNLLVNDDSCRSRLVPTYPTPTLALPATGKADLNLGQIDYGDASLKPLAADKELKAGFKFSRDVLVVHELSLENATVGTPADFNIPVGNPGVETHVTRRMARVKLQLIRQNQTQSANPSNVGGYRARYFEFPVLVNDAGLIVDCNNEIQKGDACQAMGFKYDPATNQCIPDAACQVVGYFRRNNGGSCDAANSLYPNCQCPTNTQPVFAGAVELNQIRCRKSPRCDLIRYDSVYLCMRCPP
jgi:hypothetical protein